MLENIKDNIYDYFMNTIASPYGERLREEKKGLENIINNTSCLYERGLKIMNYLCEYNESIRISLTNYDEALDLIKTYKNVMNNHGEQWCYYNDYNVVIKKLEKVMNNINPYNMLEPSLF